MVSEEINFDDIERTQRNKAIQDSKKLETFRSEIETQFFQEDDDKVNNSKKFLIDKVINGDGDFNVISDEIRAKDRRKIFNIVTVFIFAILVLILLISLAGIGVSVYILIIDSSYYKMKMYGAISSSVFALFAILSIIFVALDRLKSMAKKNGIRDYKFLLDVNIKQISIDKENILLLSSDAVDNLIIPKVKKNRFIIGSPRISPEPSEIISEVPVIQDQYFKQVPIAVKKPTGVRLVANYPKTLFLN